MNVEQCWKRIQIRTQKFGSTTLIIFLWSGKQCPILESVHDMSTESYKVWVRYILISMSTSVHISYMTIAVSLWGGIFRQARNFRRQHHKTNKENLSTKVALVTNGLKGQSHENLGSFSSKKLFRALDIYWNSFCLIFSIVQCTKLA